MRTLGAVGGLAKWSVGAVGNKAAKDAMKKKRKKKKKRRRKRIFLKLLERLREEGNEDHVRKRYPNCVKKKAHEGRG